MNIKKKFQIESFLWLKNEMSVVKQSPCIRVDMIDTNASAVDVLYIVMYSGGFRGGGARGLKRPPFHELNFILVL